MVVTGHRHLLTDQVPVGTGRRPQKNFLGRRSIFGDDVVYFRTSFYFWGRRPIFHNDVLFFVTSFYFSQHRSIFQGRRSVSRDVVLFFYDRLAYFRTSSCLPQLLILILFILLNKAVYADIIQNRVESGSHLFMHPFDPLTHRVIRI